MCGIAGAIVYQPKIATLNRFFEAVAASSARGEDGFGVVRWTRSTAWTEFRRPHCRSSEWTEVFKLLPLTEPSFYLHTSRAEPTTEWCKVKTLADIPPFRDRTIAVAHNGIISNDQELESRFCLSRNSIVDTAILPGLIRKLGVWRALKEIEGGAALGVIDAERERLYLCRNFMPITVIWEPGVICFASEARFFKGAGDPFVPFQTWDLPPFTSMELAPDGFRYPIRWGEEPDFGDKGSRKPYPDLCWMKND
jgi:7-cyano-7-deazaguanine synthase